MTGEREPDYDNVVFIDEYPHLIERRKVRQALGQLTLIANNPANQLLLFPETQPDLPDGAA